MLRKAGVMVAVALILAVPIVSRAAETQADSTQAPPPAQPSSEPAPKIEKVELLSGPPVELKKLQMLVGTWTAKTHTLESAMGPETNYTGKTTYKWQFAGMHLDGIHEYQVAGEPTFGRSTWGWDPDRKQYQIVWINRTSPVAFVYYGTLVSDSTMVLFSTFMMQGKAITQKMTYAFADADNYTMTLENDMSGEMKTVMEETGARVKAKPTAKKSASSTTKKTG